MSQMRKRVLSGIQPTGRLHLGNLIGAVENWVKLQDEYDCFFFIADLHALTSAYDSTENFREDIKQVAIDLLAAGIDPDKAVFFKQSDMPEHSELHLLYSMITPVSWLEQMPTYKSKIEELKNKDLGTYGFLGYPILQAADILIYKASFVPVGRDQLPHVEITREIARRFNAYYKETFPEPQDLLTKFPTLQGLDGRKMSKSYGNTIAISDQPEAIAKKIALLVTDPARVKRQDKGHPEVCTAHHYYQIFAKERAEPVAVECRAAQRGCVDCKKELAKYVVDYLAPIHDRRRAIESQSGRLDEVLAAGAEKARKIAAKTLLEAKQAMGLA